MAKINNIIKGVYDGSVTRHKLPENYYKAMRTDLLDRVQTGIGEVGKFGDLYESLQLNAQMFAGAKTYNLVSELESIKTLYPTYKEYEANAKIILDQHHNWAGAECNTAQQQTMQAKQWLIITDDADLFPILQYSTIGDACKICKPLDGITAPYNSAIWKKIYPCNHYNCFCIVTQHQANELELTAREKLQMVVGESSKIMSPVFLSNPGITEQLFTAKHPYFAGVPPEDRKFAKENFGLPIK